MIKFEDLIRYLLHRQREKEYQENKRRERHKEEVARKLQSSWDDEIRKNDDRLKRKVNHDFFIVYEKKKELFGTNLHIFNPEEQEKLTEYLNEDYETYPKDQEGKAPLIKKL